MEVTMMVGKHLEEEEEAHKLVGFYQGSLVRMVRYYKGLEVLLELEVILGMVVVLDLLMVSVEMMGILVVVSYLVLLVLVVAYGWGGVMELNLVVGLGWLGDKHF